MLNRRNLKWLTFSCVFLFVFQSASTFSLAPSQRVECTKNIVCALNKNYLDFFVVGDTGGIALDITQDFGNFIYATEAQSRTANIMAKVAGEYGLDFVVNVGDNVYWSGVDSVEDKRFETVFEDVYDKDQLLVPWYLIAGNHDHLGNVSAQVLYTNHSSRWTFPDLFYKAQYAFDSYRSTVDFIFIDAIVLCGNSVDVDGRSIFSWMNARKRVPNKPDSIYEKLAEERWTWIEEQLKQSRADYLFVVGHYPIHSISAHGPVKCLADRLDPLLRKYQVTAYFSGHDHSMQFFKSDNPGSPNPMYYMVSGAGSRTDYSEKFMATDGQFLVYHWPRIADLSFWRKYRKYTSHIGKGWGGFSRIRLDSNQATVQFYVKDAIMEYQEIIKPRSQKIFD